MELSFIVSAFLAGILTFLAPCTMPLVPGYLSFIGGASLADLQDPLRSKAARLKIFFNALFYVIGFSVVFVVLGSLLGLGGSTFLQYRDELTRIGGVFVIFFGIFLLASVVSTLTGNRADLLRIPPFRFLALERQARFNHKLKSGSPVSSLIFGSTFALGWTPCVGPILGTILTFAASSASVGKGAFLLFVFSLGLAIPFLAVALAIGWASTHLAKIGKYLNWISALGGLFLILLGFMMLTNNFLVWIGFVYRLFDFLNYSALLDYL